MLPYQQLLRQSAKEVREFERSAPAATSFDTGWLEALAHRMEAASSLQDAAVLEREIKAIARAILDSGPIDGTVAPSLDRVLDALQRAKKKKCVIS